MAELFAQSQDASAIGFALGQIPAGKPVFWVQDRLSALEMGRPYGLALKRFGVDPEQLVLVCARDAKDVLWSMEEALKCTVLGAVIGEVWGDPKVCDFTASKRLAVRAEKAGTHAFLIRFGASESLSAARRRWRVSSLASSTHPHDPRAPGKARWRAELFRARDTRPGIWEAGYDATAHRLDLSAPLPDPALAAPSAWRAGGRDAGHRRAAGSRA
ncbi:ImuA family protein [Minwuia sp.]|uniref:ImuA family protein n=1 Tax=Minwuia sp. TaxID=2493630 RepID=UPI003A95193B